MGPEAASASEEAASAVVGEASAPAPNASEASATSVSDEEASPWA